MFGDLLRRLDQLLRAPRPRTPAEGQAHQVLNVGLLFIDGRPQLGDRREQLGDHLFEEGRIAGMLVIVSKPDQP